MGVVASIALANFGASYGMGKAGIGIMAAGVLRPQNMIKSKLARRILIILTRPQY